ncbi:hypothetical protein NBO_60g0025 [Nosema bombycis CQ1]|uniref:Phosphatidylinositol N-acetylglucosaminyltransferase subunit C n=1 Tax=Nosema bombycis (strain CQ1 / CVCC 102059) TaxID=578461 RepID=R0M6Y6_NOSB1|nr:hypothetical protein NBO_60g0025 [Nosema bombycis CQ1]|eukprot:EOB13769.1 hypothetical protein NBO_60g0025 [Nosema bombycis CQ1]
MLKNEFYPEFKSKYQKKTRKSKVDTRLQDINRVLLRLSITLIHFVFFKIVEQGDIDNIFTKMRNTLILLLSYDMYVLRAGTKKYYKVSGLIFFLCFLLIPIIHTLTKEICYDSIYFYHFAAQIIFILNSVYYFILMDYKPTKQYTEKDILKLEESINISNKNTPSMNYGYSSMIIGVILLSSRFQNISSVFCFLSISIIFFICIPRIQENMEIHKSVGKTFLFLTFIFYLLCKTNRLLSLVFLGFTGFFYLFYTIMMNCE